ASSNDLAVDIGTYKETVSDPASTSGTPTVITGKYVATWANVNGEWKVIADIFNTDAPENAAAAGTTGLTAPGSSLAPATPGLAPTDQSGSGSTMSPGAAPTSPDTGATTPDTTAPSAPGSPSAPSAPSDQQ